MFNPYYDSVVAAITVVLHGDGTRGYLVVGEEDDHVIRVRNSYDSYERDTHRDTGVSLLHRHRGQEQDQDQYHRKECYSQYHSHHHVRGGNEKKVVLKLEDITPVQVVTVTSPMSLGDRILGFVGEPTCHH
jgi:hypothetical protein